VLIGLLILVAAAGAIGAYYRHWATRMLAEIDESAAFEWERISENDPEAVAGISRERFTEIFRRVHFPRFPKYALGVVAAFVIALPVSLSLMGVIAWLFGSAGLSPDANQLAQLIPLDGAKSLISRDSGETIATYWLQDVLRILYYFGLLATWMVIVFFAMRRYHQRRPGHLRDELYQERERMQTT